MVIEKLKVLFGRNTRRRPPAKQKSVAALKQPKRDGDFRAVEIAPSIYCCPAAMQVSGRPYLLREAPRLPLYGCTMPTRCACAFRKNADRRDGDRRLFGANETHRWFGSADNREREDRRSANK